MNNNFIGSVTGFVSSNYNLIAICIILAAALYWYMKYDLAILGGIGRGLTKINSSLEAIQGCNIAFVKQIDNIIQNSSAKLLKEIWNGYYESFKESGYGEKAPDIKEYFDVGSVIIVPADRKKAEAVPGLITAIGIIAAFLGIIIGMKGIDITGTTADQANISRFLAEMFSSLKIIIISAAASFSFQMLDKRLYYKTVNRLFVFYRLVAMKMPMSDVNWQAEILFREQLKQTETIQKISADIAVQFNKYVGSNLVPAVSKSFEDSIKGHVAPYIKITSDLLGKISKAADESQVEAMKVLVNTFMGQLNKSMGDQLTSLAATMQGFNDSQVKTAENLNALIKEMNANMENQKEINKATAEITGSITQYHMKTTEANEVLAGNLEKTGEFIKNLAEVMSTNSGMLEKLNEQRIELQKENNEYFDKMNMQMLRITQELDDHISSVFVRFTETTADIMERLEKNINLSIEGISGNTKTMLDGMDDQSRSISLYAKELSMEVHDLNMKLESAVKEFNEHLHAGIERAFSDFDVGLEEICIRFARVINDIRDSVDELPVILGVLKSDAAAAREMENEE